MKKRDQKLPSDSRPTIDTVLSKSLTGDHVFCTCCLTRIRGGMIHRLSVPLTTTGVRTMDEVCSDCSFRCERCGVVELSTTARFIHDTLRTSSPLHEARLRTNYNPNRKMCIQCMADIIPCFLCFQKWVPVSRPERCEHCHNGLYPCRACRLSFYENLPPYWLNEFPFQTHAYHTVLVPRFGPDDTFSDSDYDTSDTSDSDSEPFRLESKIKEAKAISDGVTDKEIKPWSELHERLAALPRGIDIRVCTSCFLAIKCPIVECPHARESCHGLCMECERSTNGFCSNCERVLHPLSVVRKPSVAVLSNKTDQISKLLSASAKETRSIVSSEECKFSYDTACARVGKEIVRRHIIAKDDPLDPRYVFECGTGESQSKAVAIDSEEIMGTVHMVCFDCISTCCFCGTTFVKNEKSSCRACKRVFCAECSKFFIPPRTELGMARSGKGGRRSVVIRRQTIGNCFFCTTQTTDFDKRTWEKACQELGFVSHYPKTLLSSIMSMAGVTSNGGFIKSPTDDRDTYPPGGVVPFTQQDFTKRKRKATEIDMNRSIWKLV